MEIDIDDVPWKAELVTRAPAIVDGHILVPTEPGWGAEIDEDVLRAHPWPRGSSGAETRHFYGMKA
jgi:L-alanine-DL-glutamate epimerase-like enolase superfamily enzyme